METLRETYPLESRKALKKTIGGSMIFVAIFFFLGIVPSIGLLLDERSNNLLLISLYIGMFITVPILKYIYEVYYLKYYFYDIAGENLVIRKGVFSRREITLPFNRLQDVYVNQDVLDRIFGLYDVHVSSATMLSEKFCHIDGLNKENSDVLKKLIIKGISKKDEK